MLPDDARLWHPTVGEFTVGELREARSEGREVADPLEATLAMWDYLAENPNASQDEWLRSSGAGTQDGEGSRGSGSTSVTPIHLYR